MKKLILLLALTACAMWVCADRTVLILQFPPDQRVSLTLYKTGAIDKIEGEAEVKYEFKGSRTSKINVAIKDAPAPSSIKPEYQAYVVWTVDAKGNLVNIGAISKDLKVTSPLKAFGLVISAEASANVKAPKGTFVLESGFPGKKNSFYGMTKVVYTDSQ